MIVFQDIFQNPYFFRLFFNRITTLCREFQACKEQDVGTASVT